ncbi:adenylyl-sulfate kinase [Amycolatopsis sp. NBC_01488]|uniref:adenylyl-sulfate kinase n=1 Tax=Amycolatopsis sp. NBC_01488 TaxID=2903563 RepID=UPI002E2C09E5|nr:adenylyl-sulfate kinase [Amycolatopsis sp. NBC_01488]
MVRFEGAVRSLPETPRADTGRGITVWLTGLPSAGKSTIAQGAAERLRSSGRRVEVLDGDELRRSLTQDLGFSKGDRIENVRRIGFVARLLARHGVTVLVPVIAPFAESRSDVRAGHEADDLGFVEIYVATPVDVCAARDVKGFYAEQRAGRLTGLTGIDDPYEPPPDPELVLPAHLQSAAESVEALCAFLAGRPGR